MDNRQQSNRSKFGRISFIVVLIAILAFWGHLKFSRYAAKSVLSPAADDALLLELTRNSNGSFDYRSIERLLVESIVSIVQSYYVDSDRVSNEKILKTTLETVGEDPAFSLTAFNDSQSGYTLTRNDNKDSISLTVNSNYDDLIAALLKLADFLHKNFKQETSQEQSVWRNYGVVKLVEALLAGLDAHSALLSPESYFELRQGTEGSFGGLGVLVGIRDHLLTVIKPLGKSPAKRAGIRRNDRILAIDGNLTYGYSLDQVVEYMRGEPGTIVDLSILRDQSFSPQTFQMKREVIQVDSVSSQLIKRNAFQYLKIDIETFSSRTSEELLSTIKKNKQLHGDLYGLILDLRSNPGGLLDQAVQVADLFLHSGVIVTTKGRRKEIESADGGYHEGSLPMILLVNRDSASASEIVAGALQDHGRAILIGQPTFGKGSVQTIFELPGEQALKLTIARYYTPLGRSIQNLGIIPDIWLQPIYKMPINDNLLGKNRYRNEQFLNHRLESDYEQLKISRTRPYPILKGYYLTDNQNIEGEEEGNAKDEDLNLALVILEKLSQTYGYKIPEGSQRASHWMALASPLVNKKISQMSKDADEWLRRNNNISWTLHTTEQPVNLELKVNNSNTFKVEQGKSFNINWTVTNHSDKPAQRLSLFSQAMYRGFEIQELLVGEISARQSKSGVFTVNVPPFVESGQLSLKLGLAVDAVPIQFFNKALKLQINEKKTTEIEPKVNIVREDGGKISGVIEPQERVQLKIELYNPSKISARAVKLNLKNLAGKQIKLLRQSFEVVELAPGQRKVFFTDLIASKHLLSAIVNLGIAIESLDLLLPTFHSVAFAGMPAKHEKNASNLSVH